MKIIERIPNFVDSNRRMKQFKTDKEFANSKFFIDWTKKINPTKIIVENIVDVTGVLIDNYYQISLFDNENNKYNIATFTGSELEKNELQKKINSKQK